MIKAVHTGALITSSQLWQSAWICSVPFHLPLVDGCLQPNGSGYFVPIYAQRVQVIIVEDLSVAV